MNKYIRFPSSFPASFPPSKVSKQEQPSPQVDTTLLQSFPYQSTTKIPLSPPIQAVGSIPLISTLQTVATFKGKSSSSNFQASVPSQLKTLVNLTESLW